MYEIEFSEPSASRCDCCDGLTVRLTRFVSRKGAAFAMYYAQYSNSHPDNELAMLVSIGEWGDDSDASQRAAFYCRVRPTGDSYEVMLGDVEESAWGGVDIIGKKLTRENALRHPQKATAFEVLDSALQQDPALQGFLHRAQCGDAAVPLERNFEAPDDIYVLAGKHKARTAVGRHFASLDGKRHFVRALLGVPVEGYGDWCVGLWIEVSKADYDHAKNVWDKPRLYKTLQFSGVIANDFGADLGLAVKPGSRVRLHVPAGDSPPAVEAAEASDLADLLTNTWPKAAFASCSPPRRAPSPRRRREDRSRNR